MAIRKNFLYTIITILFVAAVTLAAFVWAPSKAVAEDALSCALSHVKTESTDVTYYCFDDPISVYADINGVSVTGANGIYRIYDNAETGEKEIEYKDFGADKLRGTAYNYTIVLKDGVIKTVSDDGSVGMFDVSGIVGDIIDFDTNGDRLYALTATQAISAPLLEEGIDGGNAVVAALYSNTHTKITAGKITVADDKLYISIKAVFGNKWDLCAAELTVTSGTPVVLDTVLNSTNDILALTNSAQAASVYLLSRGEIVGYTPTESGGLYRRYAANGSDITDIYAFGGKVYALDTLNALHVMSGDLSDDSVIAAAASDANGFFNIPYGITSKKSTLYVADTGNNRVATYDSNGIRYIDRQFRNPISVAADNAGTLYIAYDDNKVGIFHGNAYTPYDEIVVTSPTLGRIRKILVDSEKTLFILADNGLWKVGNDYIPRNISATAYIDITLSIGKGNLYALGNNKVDLLDKAAGTVKSSRETAVGAISVAVDLNDTAYVLFLDKITAVPSGKGNPTEYPLELDDRPYTLGSRSGQIMLCFMEDCLDGNNDSHNYAIVLDTFKHRVLKTDGDAIGARFVDYSYVSPEIASNSLPMHGQSGIIRKIRFDTPLFDYPIETKSNYTVLGGEYVIVPDYSIVAPNYHPEETPEFALVLVDDVKNNRLIQGYVYKDALTEPLAYSTPPSEICTVSGELGTIVYKWPSRNSVAILGYSEISKNTKFYMLDFVSSFRDGYGYYWYRIALDDSGKEGYVPAVYVSTIDYQQANILPDYNAEIVGYKNKDAAQAYSLDEKGNYAEIADVKLKAGTKVEVVGAFDSSVRYTQIKYLDEKTHKTITCYVESVHIKYTGVNIVLIVAIIVIAITVILAVIIISRVYYSKKKRLDNDGDNNNTETNR